MEQQSSQAGLAISKIDWRNHLLTTLPLDCFKIYVVTKSLMILRRIRVRFVGGRKLLPFLIESLVLSLLDGALDPSLVDLELSEKELMVSLADDKLIIGVCGNWQLI